MFQNKFYLVYSQLEKKEQKEFKSYLFANHSRKKIAIETYELMASNLRQRERIDMAEEAVAQGVNKSKRLIKNGKITDAFSDLYLLLEEFLIWKTVVEKSNTERDLMLLEIFQKKGFQKLYYQKLKQIERKQSREVVSSTWLFMSKMKLKDRQYFFSDDAKLSRGEIKISEAMDQLDLFFVASKLRYSCELFSRENILQEKHDIEFLNRVIELCQNDKRFDSVYFRIYTRTLRLIRFQEAEDYLKLKTLFFDNVEVFDSKELMGIFSYMVNYTAIKIKKGQTGFIGEAFQLYKQGLEKWVFIENNFMSHIRFNNIVNLACRLGEYKWAKKFIEDWKFYLEKNIRKSAVEIGLSRVLFEQELFELAVKKLNKIKFLNSFYAIRAKTLLIRSHFELKTDANVMIHMCNAFVIYIRRNKTINNETKKGFLNFSKTLLKVLGKKHRKELLEKRLSELNPVAYKKWLLQKVTEM